MKPVTIDFETFGIERRPYYPPIPVGVSIKYWDQPARYYAWGHLSENNCTRDEAKAALTKAWKHKDGLLFQNAKFDLDVAEAHFGLPMPSWQRVHDTMFLLFLENPHSKELGLKPSAERLLGLPPDEADAVADWLIANQPIPGIKIGGGKNSKEPAGKYIAFAPGKLVGQYANGDSDRTEGLFKHLYPKIMEAMEPAYDRERRLLPALLQAERQGIRVDLGRLRSDVSSFGMWMIKIDSWITKQLKAPDLNIDSGDQLAHALIACGKADQALMGITPGGAIATNKLAIAAGVTDKVMASVLQYRAQLKTCLGTFMQPWLAMAEESNGLIFTTWNQVKAVVGTRTGRLSSTPNFQNIPKEFAPLFDKVKCPWPDLPALPLCRGYIVPYNDDEILLGRDYSQQEPRILAHFEDGALKDAYIANPWIDYHDNAREHLERVMGRPYQRKPVKNINLGIIYGQGLGSLAEKNNSTVNETKEIRDAIYALYPGLKDMYDDMRARAQADVPIVTWGSRIVYCEPSMFIKGRVQTFDYKMVNYLVQGSAADCTKEAVILFHERRPSHWRLMLQVHDEIVISVPKAEVHKAMDMLRECMESVKFDVKILSEGACSLDNWASMANYDVKGQRV